MSDQGFFQRTINLGTAGSVEYFTEDGSATGSVAVMIADTTVVYIPLLPDAVAAVGRTVVAVHIGGPNDLRVGVQAGQSLNGVPAGSVLIGIPDYSFGVFTSMGADGWLQVG